MMTRLAATILPFSLLTACAGFDQEGDADETEVAAVEHPRAIIAAELEATVLTALHASKRDARVMRTNVDRLGKTHVRVRQIVKDIPVWEGEAIVHVAPDGTTEVTDKREVDVDIDTTPRVTADRAIELARAACAGCTVEAAPDLWIVRESKAHLAWRVQLAGVQDRVRVAPIVFVDAHDGGVVRSWDNVQHATGDTQYNGLQTIPAYYVNGRYYLEDNEYNLGVYDFNGGTDPDTDNYSRIYSTDTIFQTRNYAQAMFSVRSAAEYFWGTHDRWNPDGEGGPGNATTADGSGRKRLTVLVDSQFVSNNGTIYGANASWWKDTLILGKGDADTTDWTSLDVVGHEFTHGVIEKTANLTYMNESGALNESFADVFGAMTERYRLGESANTWRLGENEYAAGGGELRRMDDPTSDGTSVDHYAERLIVSWDRGGVHFNSGIGNRAFHLVANGGSHRLGGTMKGIGADRAAEIWYLALTGYMTEGTKFIEARSATQNAARDLYGYHSVEWNAVSNAWALVGVGIVSNDNFVNGNFESDVGWEFTGRAFTTTGFPQSGTRYLLLGGLASQSGTATQDFAIDPYAKSATLSFHVNVSGSETSTFAIDRLTATLIDADTGASLGTAGTWTNLVSTTAGQYTYTSVNVSHLRGRTIRVKLHATNSPANPTTFRVDNMQVASTR